MRKALIIDDQDFVRQFLKRLLTKEFDFTVEGAVNGADGFGKFSEFDPDIIFLDVSMPVLNGLEFLKKLRSKAANDNVPVVIITANSERKLITQFIELGIQDYILKPFDYQGTTQRLKTIFDTTFSEN